MKRIGFITRNRVLAQSLSAFIKNNPDLPFEAVILQNISQTVLDAEVMKIDIAVVEMTAGSAKETEAISSLCQALRNAVPHCRILILAPPDNPAGRDAAISATRLDCADDYIFFDSTIDYLFTKLLSL